ncbi:ABC transporter substrate-binding protein [Paraburkholderia sp. RL17-337-BIB-A]|uniref:ABC transporter substrate-binding protein n=1 Tax=Paraburkholderia sp. RL17-337-BIB-A TaxID=3031636 RepID=UPI0038BC4F0C
MRILMTSTPPRSRIAYAAIFHRLGSCIRAGIGAAGVASLVACSSAATSPPAPADAVAQLAPSGTLRAAINYGNPTLATKDPATGELHGVSVDLARELARRLGVPVEFVQYPAARKVVEGARDQAWDVGFVGIDPDRAKDMVYTAPYLIIEGVYMVRQDSAIRTNADVDRTGTRIAVSGGSAYDLFLTREIKNAQLVRAPDPTQVADTMIQQSLEVAAGVKQRSEVDAKRIGGLRLLDGNFMVIRQAMATLKGRPAGARYLTAFVEDVKASGFVAASLQRNHIEGASVGPLTASGAP